MRPGPGWGGLWGIGDEAGNLCVSDANTIRKVTSSGVVTTIAGVVDQADIKLGRLPGRLENTAGIALLDAHALAVTERYSVLEIVLDAAGPRR